MKSIPFCFVFLFCACAAQKVEKPNIQDSIRSLHHNAAEKDLDTIDDLLAFNYQNAETNISKDKYPVDAAIGWRKEDTQTPYRIIRYFYQKFPPGHDDVVYDLGSGYGRVIFYGASVFPQTRFKGVELVHERVQECQKVLGSHEFRNVTFIEADVLNVDFSDGTYFYFFNPFPEIMDQVLNKLRRISQSRKITIVAIARTSRDLRNVPWLKEIHRYDPYRLGVFESR